MPRPKGIYIVERGGTKYARGSYVDKQGRRKTIERTGRNVTEMRERVKLALAEALSKTHDSENKTFSDLAQFYRENYVFPAEYIGDYKSEGLRSHDRVESFVKALERYFGKFRIDKITYFDLADFRKKRLKEPIVTVNKRGERKERPRGITSPNRELEVMRRMLNIAVQKKWLSRNPFSDGEKLIIKAAENKRDIIPDSSEEARILAACAESKSPLIKLFIIGLIDTGARANELIGSVREDYDFENKIVSLRNNKGRIKKIKKVFITERFEQALMDRGAADLDPKEKIFPVTKLRRAWEGVRKRAGLPHFHIHDLRHAFASNMSFLGVPRETVKKLIGHSPKESGVTDRYINLSDEMIDELRGIANKRNKPE